MVYWIYIKYDSGIISNIVYMSLYIFKHSFHNSPWRKEVTEKHNCASFKFVFLLLLLWCSSHWWFHLLISWVRSSETLIQIFFNILVLMRIFGPKSKELTEWWSKLNDEELHHLYLHQLWWRLYQRRWDGQSM